jgi:Xaa-Pro dipeptidase
MALACLRAGLDAIRPDIEAHAVEAPALGYPPTRLDPLQITRTSSQPLAPGSTFVLHACLLDEIEPTGVVVGGTYAITGMGVEMLCGAGAVERLTV